MHLALTRHLRWPCLLLLLLGVAPAAWACTIPVFRYALERWELSPYEVLVFHREPLPPNTQSYLDALPSKANFVVTPVDLDGPTSPVQQQLWKRHGRPASLPWVIVRRSDAGAQAAPVWTGPCDVDHLRQLVDSPIRRKAVVALREGKSVFVLLQSGDRAADESAEKLLRAQLGRLEKRVKLPEQRGDGPRIRLALPLTVGFTVLPLARGAPGEDVFVRILLQSEAGLDKVRGPIAFPIFGRGRLLGSLHGDELDAENVFEVVNFLCGECSCQVKELNPGMDLPIAANWPAIFERIGAAPESGPESPPGATRFAARAKPAADWIAAGSSKPKGTEPTEVQLAGSEHPRTVVEANTATAAPPTSPTSAHRRWLWLATAAAAVLVVVTGAWAWMQRRGGRVGRRRDATVSDSSI